jgi:RND family efflux transporter MFP subunit
MAFIKQLLVTIALLVGAAALWISFDPAPGRAILQADVSLPDEVRRAVLWLNPDSDPAAAKSAQGRPGGRAPGGPGGGGGPPLIVVGEVTEAVAQSSLKAIGTAEAERSVPVYPDATGIVASVGFRSGDDVAAGSVLVTLKNDVEKLALDRATIALQAATDQLARAERLSNSISTVQLEDYRRALDTARLDQRAAEIALDDRSVTAPIDGRVGLASIDVGDLVGNQTLIATVDDRSNLKVVFFVPESYVPSIEIGQTFQATSTARPGEVFEGRVSAVDSRLDEASRTLRVEGTIANEDDRLRPGMSFALAVGFAGDRYLALDPMAIQWERAGAYAWKIVDDRPEKAALRIVQRDIDRVLVASDELRAGDTVAVEGVQSIREGAPVRIDGNAGAPAGPAIAEGAPPPGDAPAAEPPAPAAQAPPSPARASLGFASPASARENPVR